MKRILIAIVALALVGTACGTPEETAPPPEEVPATTTTVAATTTTTVPATTTTTTTEAPPAALDPATEADKEAIRTAYRVVFSSETSFEEKAPLLDDPTGLEETVAEYMVVGKGMGGVSIEPRRITIEGDTATVLYDLLFAGTVARADLTGDAVLIDGTWKITRDKFCSIMGFARVGCPAP